MAVGGEFGLLEGRSFALIHPLVMGCLFVYTLYAGYLGWQWRRVRTIQSEINELKKQVKPVAVTPDGTPVEPPTPSPVEAQIQQLSEVNLPVCVVNLYYYMCMPLHFALSGLHFHTNDINQKHIVLFKRGDVSTKD